jgi:hypothetical protein
MNIYYQFFLNRKGKRGLCERVTGLEEYGLANQEDWGRKILMV